MSKQPTSVQLLKSPAPLSTDLLSAFNRGEVDNIVLMLAKKDGKMVFGRFLKLDVHPNLNEAITINAEDLKKVLAQ